MMKKLVRLVENIQIWHLVNDDVHVAFKALEILVILHLCALQKH